MADFTTIATEVISDAKISGNVDASLAKIAAIHGFNDYESQRLVEETNIGMFLDKMQGGTQHEDYTLASPVVLPSTSGGEGSGSLDKTASLRSTPTFIDTPDMYNISTHDEPLLKTASKVSMLDINIGDMNSESKWEKNKMESQLIFEKELKKEAGAYVDTVLGGFVASLSYSIKGNPDLVKTAIALTHTDDSFFVDSILSDTHLKMDEIISGTVSSESISSLNKIASELWENSLTKLAGASDSIKSTLKDTKGVLAYPFRNPKTTAGIIGGVATLNKVLSEDRELDHRKKMMHIDMENNYGN